MGVPDFYTENEHRAYPLVDSPGSTMTLAGSPVRLPANVLVDFRCVVGLGAGFSASRIVYLQSIARAGSHFTISFGSDAPGLAASTLVFRRAIADPEFATEFVTATQATACATVPLWEGHLVTGSLVDLAALLADGQTMTGTATMAVEPALVQDLARGFVRSVSLANVPRTYAVTPPTPPADGLHVAASCLTGSLVVRPGFNCAIRQAARTNTLTIEAAKGAGAGQPCGDVATFPGEAAPGGSVYLGGGPACKDLIVALNGAAGDAVALSAGPGFTIARDPASAHGIIVDLDQHDFATCPGA